MIKEIKIGKLYYYKKTKEEKKEYIIVTGMHEEAMLYGEPATIVLYDFVESPYSDFQCWQWKSVALKKWEEHDPN